MAVIRIWVARSPRGGLLELIGTRDAARNSAADLLGCKPAEVNLAPRPDWS